MKPGGSQFRTPTILATDWILEGRHELSLGHRLQFQSANQTTTSLTARLHRKSRPMPQTMAAFRDEEVVEEDDVEAVVQVIRPIMERRLLLNREWAWYHECEHYESDFRRPRAMRQISGNLLSIRQLTRHGHGPIDTKLLFLDANSLLATDKLSGKCPTNCQRKNWRTKQDPAGYCLCWLAFLSLSYSCQHRQECLLQLIVSLPSLP